MAARNPNSFNAYNALQQIIGLKYITDTTPDDILDDQTYVLDAPQIVVSDCFPARSSATSTYETISRYRVQCKNMCGTSSAENHSVYVYGWVSGTATLQARIIEDPDGAANTTTQTTTSTSKLWFLVSSGISMATDGSLVTFDFSFRRSAGTGTVYVAGIGVYSNET